MEMVILKPKDIKKVLKEKVIEDAHPTLGKKINYFKMWKRVTSFRDFGLLLFIDTLIVFKVHKSCPAVVVYRTFILFQWRNWPDSKWEKLSQRHSVYGNNIRVQRETI